MIFKINYLKVTYLSIHSSSIGKRFRGRLAKLPHYQHINRIGWSHNLRLKFRVSASLISNIITESQTSKVRRKQTRKLRNSYFGSALVIGGGPSMNNLSIDQIRNFQANGGKIAVINGFIYSKLSQLIVPDFYFACDPAYWENFDAEIEFRRLLNKYIASLGKSITIVQPSDKQKLVPCHDKYIYIGGFDVSGLVKIANPTSFWGLPASTSLIALSLTSYLGFNKIYFSGLDSDTYKRYFTNDLNELLLDKSKNYFYEESQLKGKNTLDGQIGILDMSKSLVPTMADVLYSHAIFFRDFEWLARKNKVSEYINVGQDTTNDISPRGCLIKNSSNQPNNNIFL